MYGKYFLKKICNFDLIQLFDGADFEEDDMLEVIIDDAPSSRETCARPIDEMVNETLMSQFYTGMFP